MITSLMIHGFRGFGEEKTIQFALPNGSSGSGLTIFVGANNSGKTTILEALRSFNSSKDSPPSFSERKRNSALRYGYIRPPFAGQCIRQVSGSSGTNRHTPALEATPTMPGHRHNGTKSYGHHPRTN